MKRIFRFLKALFKYLLYGDKVHIDEFSNRIKYCASCEYVNDETYTCGKCGCFLIKKCKMSTEHCPLKKW